MSRSRRDSFAGNVTYAPGSNGSSREFFAVSDGTVYEDYEGSTTWSGWSSRTGSAISEDVTYAPGAPARHKSSSPFPAATCTRTGQP